MSRTQIFLLRVQSFLSWLVYAVIAGPLFCLFLRLFSYKVYNKHNLKGLKPPFILVSNHLSLIDSWFVQYAIGFPQFYFKPWIMPWNLPEGTNYFRGIIAPFIWLSRSIPIVRLGAAKDKKLSIDKVIDVLRNKEAVHIFPEATRSRTGRMERYTNGVGRVYLSVPDVTILPVYIRGMEHVLPINVKVPRLFKKIDVVIGRPIKPVSDCIGAKAAMDISKQAFDVLVGMEKDYFKSGKYRANEM